MPLPAPIVAGQVVRARQTLGPAQSDWSAPATALDHMKEFPAGPPCPVINPAPIHEYGIRTGVGNLLAGGNVWITADGIEVGMAEGCNPQQGVNVAPAYSLNQRVRAWFDLCSDPSPPSAEEMTQKPASPLPAPGCDPIVEGGEQLGINNIVNGAEVTLLGNGLNQGTWGCWGGRLTVGLNPPFSASDVFRATHEMCPGDPESPPCPEPARLRPAQASAGLQQQEEPE